MCVSSISGDGGDCEQWVEIIEPQSKERMFANPITGEIRLQAPIEAIVYVPYIIHVYTYPFIFIHTHTHTHL